MIVYLLSFHLLLQQIAGFFQDWHHVSSPSNINSPLHHYKAVIQDIPYHVLIAFNRLYCSGALIKSRVVLTAASGLTNWHGQRIVIKVGSDTVTGLGQVMEVIEVKTHEYFGLNSMLDNDIALLMLNDHVQFVGPGVMKVVLADFDKALVSGSTLVVSGWGFLGQQSTKYASSLLWSDMTVINTHECAQAYPDLITMSNFCAKYPVERSLSDNGGPAVFKNQLVGILSYGASKNEEPYVALLTNVSYFHRWISLNVFRLMTKYCVEIITDELNYNLEDFEE